MKRYLDRLASDAPVPGGGGTSALVGALAIALVLMVARIAAKKLQRRSRKQTQRLIQLLERLRRDVEQAIDLDPKVYRQVIQSYRRLKGARDRRRAQAEVETALANSFRLQADLALLLTMAREILAQVGPIAKGSIRNDLVVASGLLDGAFQGAQATARINAVSIKSTKRRRHFERALAKVEQRYKRVRPS